MMKTIGEWGRDPTQFAQWFDHAIACAAALVPLAVAGPLEHLHDEPRSASELAADAGLDAAQLERLLAFLASQGGLRFENGRYAHTEFSRLLTRDHPRSLYPFIYCLRGIRAAIAAGGRLAVFDRLMPETPRPHPAFHMDLHMMLLLGAQERKLSAFETLFADSGFRLDRVTEFPEGPSVIEAVPV